MKRRAFLTWLAALPAALSWSRFLARSAPVTVAAAEAATPALPALTLGTGVNGAAAMVPFFWDAEIVTGILAVPLLDRLVAEEIGITLNYAEE